MLEQFLQTSAWEWFATITGFLCVYLAARQHILNWPLSILSVSTYAYIFYHSKLYGDMILQFYFISTAIYGWYYWQKQKADQDITLSRLNTRGWSFTLLSIALLTGVLGLFLARYTDSDVPYIDGFCTACSFVAQFLLTRKVVENWILWVFVDLCYIPLYLHKDLMLTSLLYIAFAIIAFRGYITWRRTYSLQGT